ncbi:Endoglucanase [Dactylella cylindrospora]|nr:Endoglucanase [Dactylella cylindrospora]
MNDDQPPKVKETTRTMSRRRFVILLVVSSVFLSGLVPYFLYRNILQQNFYFAPIDTLYPSHDEIARTLNCPVRPNKTLHDEGSPESEKPPLFKLPLKTQGRNIVDFSGERVKLISINWYGASDQDFVPGGLDVRHRKDIAKTIREMGFNSVRLPYSDELVTTNPDVLAKFWWKNPDLLKRNENSRYSTEISDKESAPGKAKGEGRAEKGGGPHDGQLTRDPYAVGVGRDSNITVKALDIFEAVVTALTDEGIAVITNNHITQARWCCDANLCDATWANEYLGKVCRIVQTEEQWIQNWETVMKRYVDNPLVIGADLRNENRSPLGQMLWPLWATAAEKAANRLHKMQPNWLMFVEGVASSNYLQGVRSRPVNITIPNRVVYSAHVYGWSGWGSLLKGPYWSRDYASFAYDMYDNWGFILEGNIAPVWVGEFGAPDVPNTGDIKYWGNLMSFLKDVDADWGYWAINPRKPDGNVTETYSLLEDDWVTPKCDYRMYDLWQIGMTPYNSSAPSEATSTTTVEPGKTDAPAVQGDRKQLPFSS